MRRKRQTQPTLKLSFWKQDGKLWYANAADLIAAIKASNLTDSEMQHRMGVGYIHIQEVLDGKRIDGWSAAHIEFGISPEKIETKKTLTWPPT